MFKLIFGNYNIANIIIICYSNLGDFMNKYFDYKEEHFSICYNFDSKPNKNNFRLHTHEFCEIYCFFEGKGVFKVEGSSYPLHSGDILIMRPGEAHYIDIDPSLPYKRLSIHFDISLFDSLDNSRSLFRSFQSRDRGKLNLYTKREFTSDSYKLFIKNICNDAENRRLNTLINLPLLLNEIALAFDNRDKDTVNNLLISEILSYINCHLTEKLTLENICREFYLSKPHLCRIFKSCTGSTVWEYIIAKRLLMAKRLIKSGKNPSEIFNDCGFGDYSSFFRAFKKRFGVSPNSIN